MGQVTLRPARAEDLAAIDRIYRAARVLEVGDDPDQDRRFRRVPGPWTMVAADGDDVIGFVTVSGDEIRLLYVAPDRHGEGVGRLLLQAALSEIGGVAKLAVYKGNARARAIYARAGFELETTLGDTLVLRRDAS